MHQNSRPPAPTRRTPRRISQASDAQGRSWTTRAAFFTRPFLPRGANRSSLMPYIVKWIPKHLDMPIDHSTHYEQPEQAMEFASNILALEPKRIWIEDHEGLMHADHDKVLEHSWTRASRSR